MTVTVEPNYIKNLEKENNLLLEDVRHFSLKSLELDKENAQLIQENTKLKQNLEFWQDKAQGNHNELSHQFQENQQLKNEIIKLKTKLYDATVKEQRLLKILNETSDYN